VKPGEPFLQQTLIHLQIFHCTFTTLLRYICPGADLEGFSTPLYYMSKVESCSTGLVAFLCMYEKKHRKRKRNSQVILWSILRSFEIEIL